jgi:hypothetical protein
MSSILVSSKSVIELCQACAQGIREARAQADVEHIEDYRKYWNGRWAVRLGFVREIDISVAKEKVDKGDDCDIFDGLFYPSCKGEKAMALADGLIKAACFAQAHGNGMVTLDASEAARLVSWLPKEKSAALKELIPAVEKA